jgi:hypothetical protein
VIVIIIVMADFDLWPFQVGDLRIIIPAIRIVSQDSLGMPRSRQYPREYFSTAIGEPACNVFSRKVLHLDDLSIVLRLHRPHFVRYQNSK